MLYFYYKRLCINAKFLFLKFIISGKTTVSTHLIIFAEIKKYIYMQK